MRRSLMSAPAMSASSCSTMPAQIAAASWHNACRSSAPPCVSSRSAHTHRVPSRTLAPRCIAVPPVARDISRSACISAGASGPASALREAPPRTRRFRRRPGITARRGSARGQRVDVAVGVAAAVAAVDQSRLGADQCLDHERARRELRYVEGSVFRRDLLGERAPPTADGCIGACAWIATSNGRQALRRGRRRGPPSGRDR